jgi:hypothetical protein
MGRGDFLLNFFGWPELWNHNLCYYSGIRRAVSIAVPLVLLVIIFLCLTLLAQRAIDINYYFEKKGS